jgi:hypothetical protein
MGKTYFYVDETGQDTKGNLFIIGIAIAENEPLLWHSACERVEKVSQKGERKWIKSKPNRRFAYIKQVLETSIFSGKLAFAVNNSGLDYDTMTAWAIARAVAYVSNEQAKVIYVDGLPKEKFRDYGKLIRGYGERIERVKGIKKDENNSMIRLADAVCGFVRAAGKDHPAAKRMLAQAIAKGVIVDLKK